MKQSRINLKSKHLLLIFILICSLSDLIAGGPWLQNKNNGYGQISISAITSYDELFSNSGEPIRLNRNVTDITIMGYLEYGLVDYLTLIAHFPFKLVRTAEEVNSVSDYPDILPSGNLAGFGNISLAVKSNFIDGPVILSGQIRIDANTAKFDKNNGLRTGYYAWGFIPSVIVGGSFGKFYTFLDLGARLQTNRYSSNAVVNMEVGYSLFQNFWISAALDVLSTLSDGSRDPDGSEQTGLYADNQEYLAYGLKLITDVSPEWGVNASIFSAGSGNLVARSMAYTIGIYHKW